MKGWHHFQKPTSSSQFPRHVLLPKSLQNNPQAGGPDIQDMSMWRRSGFKHNTQASVEAELSCLSLLSAAPQGWVLKLDYARKSSLGIGEASSSGL